MHDGYFYALISTASLIIYAQKAYNTRFAADERAQYRLSWWNDIQISMAILVFLYSHTKRNDRE